MPRLLAFLRSINVGGHTVTMPRLRAAFEKQGFTEVDTFIASGNVCFTTPLRPSRALEQRIAAALESELGFPADTFLRTGSELARLTAHAAFPAAAVAAAGALNVALLHQPLTAAQEQALLGLRTPLDEFAVGRREIYWLCQVRQSQSTISNRVLEKTLGQSTTLRGIKTLQQMTAQYGTP